jgi:2-oxo-4-hydroxy-4-carboxy-5-ureidoimidazoline decarboxylase
VKLDVINAWTEAEAQAAFRRCCGSTRWAQQLAARRPFASEEELLAVATEVWQALAPGDWQEAFAAHPRIGEDPAALRNKFRSTAAWSTQEQAGVAGASEATLQALADANRAYQAKFGYLFIVCASGKTADEMLAFLQQRLGNRPDKELRVAAAEQEKITRLRLQRLGL